jgi:hypothetical protein
MWLIMRDEVSAAVVDEPDGAEEEEEEDDDDIEGLLRIVGPCGRDSEPGWGMFDVELVVELVPGAAGAVLFGAGMLAGKDSSMDESSSNGLRFWSEAPISCRNGVDIVAAVRASRYVTQLSVGPVRVAYVGVGLKLGKSRTVCFLSPRELGIVVFGWGEGMSRWGIGRHVCIVGTGASCGDLLAMMQSSEIRSRRLTVVTCNKVTNQGNSLLLRCTASSKEHHGDLSRPV